MADAAIAMTAHQVWWCRRGAELRPMVVTITTHTTGVSLSIGVYRYSKDLVTECLDAALAMLAADGVRVLRVDDLNPPEDA